MSDGKDSKREMMYCIRQAEKKGIRAIAVGPAGPIDMAVAVKDKETGEETSNHLFGA